MLGTTLGLPLSTTHCAIGSLFGIIAANQSQFVARVYDPANFSPIQSAKDTAATEEGESPVEKENDENKVWNKDLILKIVGLWLATVPVAIGLAWICTEAAIKA